MSLSCSTGASDGTSSFGKASTVGAPRSSIVWPTTCGGSSLKWQAFLPATLSICALWPKAYPSEQFVQQAVAQIPWGHNVRILDYVKSPAEREWYIRQTVENGWSRNVLVHQIESGLYKRQGKALTNFPTTLPPPQSDLAQQIVKDPYNFDFLTLAPQAQEREVERGLIEHIRDFLLELGVGFSFVGSQYLLEVGGQDFRLDLLFTTSSFAHSSSWS